MTERLLSELRALLGDKGCLSAPTVLSAWENGSRYDQGRTLAVLRPATTAEASACMAACTRASVAVVPQSGNTGLVGGGTPDASGTQVILSLDRMIAQFDLDADNRSLAVSAGVRLGDLNRRLVADDLCFPIDLGADPCVGGMIATNTGGARFLRYGDVRTNTLGVTVVLGDTSGTILRLGGPLLKNNTGPDWKQMFIGTCGVFGIITEAVLRVHPRPAQTATAILVPSSDEVVLSLLRAMERAFGPELTAFESMSGNAVRAALDHVPQLRNPFAGPVPDLAILAEVSRAAGPRGDAVPLEADFQDMLGGVMVDQPDLLADALFGPAEQVWALRHALSEGVRHKGRLIAFDLSFRRGDVMRFLARMKAEMPVRFPDVTICDFGHLGDGAVHFNLSVPPTSALATDKAAETALRDWVIDMTVSEFGGSFSAEHAIGRRNQAYYDRHTPEPHKVLARAFQSATTPAGHPAIRFA